MWKGHIPRCMINENFHPADGCIQEMGEKPTNRQGSENFITTLLKNLQTISCCETLIEFVFLFVSS
jgi:hypothetical protein